MFFFTIVCMELVFIIRAYRLRFTPLKLKDRKIKRE